MITSRGWGLSIICRYFSHGAALKSGHNRWSKIKHDKAKVDASVGKRNAAISNELIKLSKAFGPNPQVNGQLAQLIASAKKQGYPKQSIEHAIARGQGVSPTGATLENVTIEAMLPSGVAAIIECQTDSKMRTVNELRNLISRNGGTAAPTSHMFEKKGRIVFNKPNGLSEENILDHAIEAGATELEVTEDAKIEVFTEPSSTAIAIQALAESLGLKAESSEIIWGPKEETAIPYPRSDVLDQLIEKIEDDTSVQDVYLNTI